MTVSAKSIATAVMAVAFGPPCAGAWTGGGDYWTAGVDCATDLSLGTALIQSERFECCRLWVARENRIDVLHDVGRDLQEVPLVFQRNAPVRRRSALVRAASWRGVPGRDFFGGVLRHYKTIAPAGGIFRGALSVHADVMDAVVDRGAGHTSLSVCRRNS